jgi:hypothetical protein
MKFEAIQVKQMMEYKGRECFCIGGGRSQQRKNTKDAHFNVLGFTTSSIEAVVCYIQDGES